MPRARIHFAISLLVALAAPALTAAPETAAIKPEDGYLSPTRYLNRYFGLSLTFPTALNLVPSPLAQVQGSTRWLLAMQTFGGKQSLSLIITAEPRTRKDAVSVLRSDFADLSDKPKPVTVGGQNFWKAVVPRESVFQQQPQTVEYAGILRDYAIRIRITTSAGEVPGAIMTAVEGAAFVLPEAVAAARSSDMLEYVGPAYPELGKPTEAMAKLDGGTIDGRHYRNDTLGIDFAIPQGLKAHPQERLQSENEQMWGSQSPIEHQVTQACTRTLLIADDGTRRSDGHVSPAVTLMAVDRLCMGGVRFPGSTSDTRDVQLVASLLAQHVGTVHAAEMKGRVYLLEGHVMLNVSGFLYGTEPGTGLRIPNRVRLIATELSSYWVLWTFLAPDTAALDRVAGTTVSFYPAREVSQKAGRLR